MRMNKRSSVLAILIGIRLVVATRAEDSILPTYRGFAGAIWDARLHRYFVESELSLPLLQTGPVSLAYRYAETTPFITFDGGGTQAEVLFTRYAAQADWKLSEPIRLSALAGYRQVHRCDRAGQFGAAVAGLGMGGPPRSERERVFWQAQAGAFLERDRFGGDEWVDASLSWRVIDFAREKYLGSPYRASFVLAADVEGVLDGDDFRAFYRLGPELQLVTAYGNKASLHLQWIHNSGNPFYGVEDTGILFGFDVVSSFDSRRDLRAREEREPGWLPLVWGAYEVGVGDHRWLNRFEADVELVDFAALDHRSTVFVWYESRQEYRRGDFDNIAYSVALGLQTRVGWESALSQGDPLVCGFDFFHRSEHALNPEAARVTAIGQTVEIGGKSVQFLAHGAQNLLPRLRLQTLGWDLPYRDPSMYERATRWLNRCDWRMVAGYDLKEDRDEGNVTAQLGINWDAASVNGCVLYARGVATVGIETPDWLAEVGVRRPMGKLFARYEFYDMVRDVARGNSFLFGAGFNL